MKKKTSKKGYMHIADTGHVDWPDIAYYPIANLYQTITLQFTLLWVQLRASPEWEIKGKGCETKTVLRTIKTFRENDSNI